jgi:pantoate--beta-alanine ligase
MPPLIATTIEETRRALRPFLAAGQSVGLVPTMGSLHEGHASLLRQAKRDNDIVVASIFVNPTQFGPNEDFHRYPRPFDDDVALCTAAGVDLIFHPEPAELYPVGFQTFVEVQELQKPLCGTSRPTHFRGVATVVLKLLQIVQPKRAYFGQKDAQQARLVTQMARDLDVPVEIAIRPIVREPDGLAMSSRNRYLTPEARRNATILFRTLEMVRERVEAGERRSAVLIAAAKAMIESVPGATIDYVSIVDWEDLEPLEEMQGEVLVALAVFFGTTRLIDNWRTTLK